MERIITDLYEDIKMNDEEIFARILESLDEVERGDIPSTGEGMIERMRGGRIPINAIPSNVPGSCHDTLIVAIGENESELVELRILYALKHILYHCPKKTTKVIFWAGAWNSAAWKKHRDAFEKVDVYLKLIGFRPIREAGFHKRR